LDTINTNCFSSKNETCKEGIPKMMLEQNHDIINNGSNHNATHFKTIVGKIFKITLIIEKYAKRRMRIYSSYYILEE
jgi:hypothetical protein